jgi:hypothetical protein
MDPSAPEGLDLNSQAVVFPGLGDYQRVLQSDEAPTRHVAASMLWRHVVAADLQAKVQVAVDPRPVPASLLIRRDQGLRAVVEVLRVPGP